jgi:hypothetical protein
MRHIVERSSALFFLTSATNIAALIGAGAVLAAGLLAGPHDLLRTGLPVLGGLIVTAFVLVVPALVRRSPRARRTTWLFDLAAGIDGARRSLIRPSWRLIVALGYLGLDIAALAAAFAATGRPLPVAPLVLALGDHRRGGLGGGRAVSADAAAHHPEAIRGARWIR